MPLPTLLVAGNLQAPDGSVETKAKLDSFIPIEYITQWFKSRQYSTGVANRVLILKSETASGKSTAAPAYLYRDIVRPLIKPNDARGLIITQPRILTAIENVKEVLKQESNRGFLKLGHTIGWSTGANKLRPEAYGLLSATIGTLTQILRTCTDDEIIARFRIILIDETHERDLQTDLTIYLLKSLIYRQRDNPACPFVALMSATFEPESFLRYFDIPRETNYIYCKGFAFEKREMWGWNDHDGKPQVIANYLRAAARLAFRIHVANPQDTRGDIMVFLPGTGEIRTVGDFIDEDMASHAASGKPVAAVLRIDSDTIKAGGRDYLSMMKLSANDVIVEYGGKLYKAMRRIVLTTNVAETGLTLDDLKYVIDAGFNREIEFNPIYGLESLLTKPAPMSRIIQRRGRAGRKFAGVFYPLYSLETASALPRNQLPTILLSDFSELLLDVIYEQLRAQLRGEKFSELLLGEFPTLKMFDPWAIDMVDPPTPDALRYAMEKAYALGFIGEPALCWPISIREIEHVQGVPLRAGLGLTRRGAIARCAFSTSIPLEVASMILAGFTWGVSIIDLVSLASYLIATDSVNIPRKTDAASGKPPTEMPVDWEYIYERYDGSREAIGDNFIDMLYLHKYAFESFDLPAEECREELQRRCDRCNINSKVVYNALAIRESILEGLMAAGIDCWRNFPPLDLPDYITRIKLCIHEGFRLNLLTLREDGYYTRRGLKVADPQLRSQAEKKAFPQSALDSLRPKYLLYAKLSLKEARAESKKPLAPAKVKSAIHCILDGFLSPDENFLCSI